MATAARLQVIYDEANPKSGKEMTITKKQVQRTLQYTQFNPCCMIQLATGVGNMCLQSGLGIQACLGTR